MKHRVSKVPVEQIPAPLREIMDDVDDAIGGSEWMQVFAHAPALYGDFAKFYYDHILTDSGGVSVRLTELVRHRVALHNECYL